ncbi:AAA family ATPase [Roseateles toxinivorans]|uniref:5-methylcytosine-specific restriction protein B n=1 Tax=Roseateles toxinivorans TaxID=270368 RepID=A0A4R6QTL8_9BURK|nr:AAA family ATPase [Roseateles toxinivorans]TDP74737.1 5-methylcytosine-specific restriction protein B [Roseateles toxinivorans]
MTEKTSVASPVCWFVGASFGGTNDQTPRFLAEGVWEVDSPTEKESAHVNSMKPGERIAIKAAYVRKHDLPFDNRGQSVAVMAIKATGVVLSNERNGHSVKVKWSPVSPPREWYFYTYQRTMWRVEAGEWSSDALIAFAFENQPQDLERFCNAPYWRERFGTGAPDQRRFGWTRFFEAVADKLLVFRSMRAELIAGLQEIGTRNDVLDYLAVDKRTDGTKGWVRDICPFTVMGSFNRGITDSNRKKLAAELAKFLDVDEAVPSSFEGIPLLHNMKSWYFPFEEERQSDHIDSLWEVFAAGLAYAGSDEASLRVRFSEAFDRANGRPNVGWNLTIGLYWIRPWSFLSLDGNSQAYLSNKLGLRLGKSGPKGRCAAADYLAAMDALEPRFKEVDYPVHSYPEMSLEAWTYQDPVATIGESVSIDELIVAEVDDSASDTVRPMASLEPFSVSDILKDGCFLERDELERMLERWREKKNLILQGPPGTGKTWLAKRLAYALMTQKDEARIRAVQFHPNLSYEDFVRGWRPAGDGKLSLVDGVFMEAINAAKAKPNLKFVVVIEEINRGNPAQIFGELLTLLEAGKRTPSEALELCYADADGRRRAVHIPENLYVIGTMNIADRSLALVDLALRRRFAFIGLEPRLGPVWRDWVVKTRGLDTSVAQDIEQRVNELNEAIASDARLGKQFRVGHSYVTPAHALEAGSARRWFEQVVETEIGPLLEEYWFDAPDEARKACERLLKGW